METRGICFCSFCDDCFATCHCNLCLDNEKNEVKKIIPRYIEQKERIDQNHYRCRGCAIGWTGWENAH